MKSKILKLRKILILDGILLLVIFGMFLFVRCRHRDAFTDKGYYKNISLEGTWYKVDLDEMYVVRFSGDSFDEKDVYGEQPRKGKYEVGNHALRLGSKEYSMKYVDEEEEWKDIIGSDTDGYQLRKYFYTIDSEGNKVYYFRDEEDAADQLDYNCQTNAYYKKAGMFDEQGFAIDEEGMLLAYNGDMQEIVLPSSVTEIAENAFSADYDRALNTRKVIIPSNVKKIDSGAFFFSNVSTVVVQKGVERIEEWAFGDSNIKDIHLPDYIPEMSPSMFETEEGVKGLRIHCTSGSRTEQFIKENPPEGSYEIVNKE